MNDEHESFSYEAGLAEFYSGEIMGECIFSALLESCDDPCQRLKLGHVLQLETETKAWLRPFLLAAGLSIAEPVALREQAAEHIETFRAMGLEEFMASLAGFTRFGADRYRKYADAARASGNAEQAAVCDFMVEHELAQAEFAELDAKGAELKDILAPLLRHSRYPLPVSC